MRIEVKEVERIGTINTNVSNKPRIFLHLIPFLCPIRQLTIVQSLRDYVIHCPRDCITLPFTSKAQFTNMYLIPLTREQISRQMTDRNLTLPRIISINYKRPLMTIILTCTEHKSTNQLTCFSVKRMSAKKKEGTYRLLFDEYLHSWNVVHVDMKTHIFAKLFKKSFTCNKIIYRTLIRIQYINICRGWNNQKKITPVLLQGFYMNRCISSINYTSLKEGTFRNSGPCVELGT